MKWYGCMEKCFLEKPQTLIAVNDTVCQFGI